MIPRVRPEATARDLLAVASPADRGAGMRAFAADLAERLETDSAPMIVPSGRAALWLLFLELPHDLVYLPGYTCWAVLEAAGLAGKRVELLDIDYPGVHVRAEEWERIRNRPGIVVATHQLGWPEDVPRLRTLLGDGGHFVVEDCAGAMLSRLRGSALGRDGDAAVWSFETGKLLTSGGGALTVNDPALRARLDARIGRETRPGRSAIELARVLARVAATHPAAYAILLRLYLLVRPPTEGAHAPASEPDRWYRQAMSPGQRRLAGRLLDRIDAVAARRRAVVAAYDAALDGVPGVRRVAALDEADPCPIRYPFLLGSGDKRALHARMRAHGVDLGFTFSYALDGEPECRGARRFAHEVLNLPIHRDVDVSGACTVAARLAASVRE